MPDFAVTSVGTLRFGPLSPLGAAERDAEPQALGQGVTPKRPGACQAVTAQLVPSWVEKRYSHTLLESQRGRTCSLSFQQNLSSPVTLLQGAERRRSVQMRNGSFKFNADEEIFLLFPAESRCSRFAQARRL